MMISNLNLAKLPECVCEMRYIDSALLTPCAEYQRVLRTRKVEEISATFSEYVANEPRVSYRDGRYHVFDGQNTIEARIACNGGHDLPILCKVFHGLSKKDEALLFAVQTGISTDLTAGERLRADIVAEDEDACAFVAATEAAGATFALDGIRAEWKIYCIRTQRADWSACLAAAGWPWSSAAVCRRTGSAEDSSTSPQCCPAVPPACRGRTAGQGCRSPAVPGTPPAPVLPSGQNPLFCLSALID